MEDNSPAFQGIKDGNQLWKASGYSVAIDVNGFVTISGNNDIGSLSLMVPSASVGVYTLGDVSSMEANFTAGPNVFSTGNDGVGSPVFISDGEIVLEEVNIIDNTFTGTFKFNAYDASGQNSLNFIEGVFFKLPVSSGQIPSVVYTCIDAQTDATAARLAYEATFDSELEFINSDDYVAACSAYNEALETQMTYCGDVNADIQTIINSLVGCVFRCEHALANRNTAQTNFEAATIGNYIALCNTYNFYLGQQIEFCGDDDGAIQADIDALNCNDDDGDGVPTAFEDINGDGDLDNDDTDGDGTPDYLDTDDDDDGILTIDEEKDADGNPLDTDMDGILNYLDTDDDGDSILTINETGDTDGDGVDNYLDQDDDGDGVFTIFENPDLNADGDPADAQDTDVDGVADYLDTDDDGDGMLTADEMPDPDGDGNPADATDADMDGIPDYLDNA